MDTPHQFHAFQQGSLGVLCLLDVEDDFRFLCFKTEAAMHLGTVVLPGQENGERADVLTRSIKRTVSLSSSLCLSLHCLEWRQSSCRH